MKHFLPLPPHCPQTPPLPPHCPPDPPLPPPPTSLHPVFLTSVHILRSVQLSRTTVKVSVSLSLSHSLDVSMATESSISAVTCYTSTPRQLSINPDCQPLERGLRTAPIITNKPAVDSPLRPDAGGRRGRAPAAPGDLVGPEGRGVDIPQADEGNETLGGRHLQTRHSVGDDDGDGGGGRGRPVGEEGVGTGRSDVKGRQDAEGQQQRILGRRRKRTEIRTQQSQRLSSHTAFLPSDSILVAMRSSKQGPESDWTRTVSQSQMNFRRLAMNSAGRTMRD